MKKNQVCFMCNTPTNETREFDRIMNLKPIPLCKNCQEILK